MADYFESAWSTNKLCRLSIERIGKASDRMPKTANVVVGASTLLMIVAGAGHGASDSKLTGNVDASDLPAPGAEIWLRNSPTLVERAVATNNEGIYEVPALPNGVYRVQVKEPEFRRYLVEALTTDDGRAVQGQPGNVAATPGFGRSTATRVPTGESDRRARCSVALSCCFR